MPTPFKLTESPIIMGYISNLSPLSIRPEGSLTSIPVGVDLTEGNWTVGKLAAATVNNFSVILIAGSDAGIGPSTHIGEFRDFASIAAVPPLWLVCDGVPKNRVTYAKLFAKIATIWGVGDGSTTFGIPNFIGGFARGSLADGSDAGAVGGSADAVLTQHQHADTLAGPAHNHADTISATQAAHAHLAFNYGTGTESFLVNLSTSSGIDAWVPFAGPSGSPPAALNGVYSWMALGYGGAMQNATPVITVAGSVGAATATALTGSVGNVSGATTASPTGANLPPYGTVVRAIYAGE